MITTTDKIRAEAKRVEESAKYSSETQFEYAKRWRRVDRWFGGASAGLAGAAGVGGLSDVLSPAVAGSIAVVAAVAAAVATSLGAPKTKERAAIAANSLRALQQDARMFIDLDLDTMQDADARERLQSLVDRLQELNREAEIPSRGAWHRARRSIESGAQNYEVDDSA